LLPRESQWLVTEIRDGAEILRAIESASEIGHQACRKGATQGGSVPRDRHASLGTDGLSMNGTT
jgi:hypothetical protein